MALKTRVTVEEYLALPEDGPPWLEYICGEVVEKPVGDLEHTTVQARFVIRLEPHRQEHGGRTGTEGRSRFDDPDDPRYMLPDVSFFRRGARLRDGRLMLPPTFAVEIRSPGQTANTQRERCRYYLAHGVEEAWLVDPHRGTIEVFDGERDGVVYTSGAVSSSALPGFSVEIEALFEGLDDEYA